MHKQVITIDTAGIVSGLQRKPGQGLDLTKFGKADVRRASEIVWDADAQAWKIDVLQEAGRGVITGWTWGLALYGEEAIIRNPSYCSDMAFAKVAMIGSSFRPSRDTENPLLFGEYDDAVKVEIAYLDALRLKGAF